MKTFAILTALIISQIFSIKTCLASSNSFDSIESRQDIIKDIETNINNIQNQLKEQNNQHLINYKLIILENDIKKLNYSFETKKLALEENRFNWDKWQIGIGALALLVPLIGIWIQLDSQNKHRYAEWKAKLSEKIIEEVLKTDDETNHKYRAEKIWTMLSSFEEKDLNSFKPFFEQFEVNVDEQQILDDKIKGIISNLYSSKFDGTDNQEICQKVNDLFKAKKPGIKIIWHHIFTWR